LKTKLVFALKFFALVILYFVSFSLISGMLLPRLQQTSADSDTAALPALLIMSLLNTAVLTYLTVRSRWGGWRLVVAIAFILFGVSTVMPQIETAVFIHNLPRGFLPRLILAGFLFSALFAALLVLILGKIRRYDSSQVSQWIRMSGSQWIVRLSVIAFFYVVIYFTFGYFIAWKNPAVRAYYGGGSLNGFVSQIYQTWQDIPWVFPLQFLRGLLWTALALPVIRMMRGAWWETGLVVALLFGVVMNTQLLLPNPLMPHEVRMTHLLETASSNVIFGWVLVWLLRIKDAERTN
jgi:hypothetical protein